MSIFPTQYSTLSAAALKDFLSEKYNLKDANCRLLIHNVSDTYLLEDLKSKYIFKIYRDQHRKLSEIKAEVELLNILHQRGVKVSYPLEDGNGGQIQSFNAAEGTRYGVLFSYAKGEPVYAMSDRQLEMVGKEMALFHEVASSVELSYPRKEYNLDTLLIRPLALIKPAFEHLEDEYEYLVNACKKVAEGMMNIDVEKFSYGYCHYDFLPKNFHFDGEGGLTFFDFDFVGKGYLINDISSFYVHFFLEVLHGKITQEEADRSFRVFIKAYRSVRVLRDEELDAIPYFGFAFWVFYLGFHFENFEDCSSQIFGPRYIKGVVGFLRKWMEWLNGLQIRSSMIGKTFPDQQDG